MASHAASLTIDDSAPPFHQAYDTMQTYTDRVVGVPTLFTRRRRATPYIEPGYLDRDGVADAIRALYHHLRAEPDTARLAA